VSALLNAEGDPAESNIRRTQLQVHDLDSIAAVLPKFSKGETHPTPPITLECEIEAAGCEAIYFV